MSQYDPQKVEQLQLILLKNPRSPVFANLAEAYRKMGLLDEALEVTTRGVLHNPEFVSGLVAHAKILFEMRSYPQAIKALEKAHALSPQNILALKLLGYSHLKIKEQHKALKFFKKLLILKPNDASIIQIVKKWEFLDNLPISDDASHFSLTGYEKWVHKLPDEESVVHLIESFIQQGDSETALEVASVALFQWPTSDAIKRRQELLLKPPQNQLNQAPPADEVALKIIQAKIAIHQGWLQRIEQSKVIDR